MGDTYVVLSEENSGGTLIRSYMDEDLKCVDGSNPTMGDYVYGQADTLNSPRLEVDESKNAQRTTGFTPFGDSYFCIGDA